MFGAWKTVQLVTVSEQKYPCLWWMYNTSSKLFVESGPMPLPSTNSGGMGSKSIFRGPTNIFRNKSQNNVDILKMDRSLSTKCSLFLGV